MVLKADCIRDILLAVESCPFDEMLDVSDLRQRLPQHSEDDLWYTCLKLEEGGYISMFTTKSAASFRPMIVGVYDLTYRGHEFLDRIRDEKQWSSVKKGMAALRNYSLEAISALARGMTDSAISAYLTEIGRTV